MQECETPDLLGTGHHRKEVFKNKKIIHERKESLSSVIHQRLMFWLFLSLHMVISHW